MEAGKAQHAVGALVEASKAQHAVGAPVATGKAHRADGAQGDTGKAQHAVGAPATQNLIWSCKLKEKQAATNYWAEPLKASKDRQGWDGLAVGIRRLEQSSSVHSVKQCHVVHKQLG